VYPAKLVSYFSDFPVNFYTIYKNQHFTLTIEVYLCEKDTGNSLGFAIGYLWRPAGAARRNPARPAALLAGERAEEGLGVLRDWFGALDEVEAAGGEVLGGAPGWLPLERLLRRASWPKASGGGAVSTQAV
jgi:hypothetical protein